MSDRSRRIRVPAVLRKFASDRSGVQFIEFALTLPFFFFGFGAALEDYNYAVVNMQVSKYALDLADVSARIGLTAGSNGSVQVRESDINDVLTGTRLQGEKLKLTTYGRIFLFSLERVTQDYDPQGQEPPQRTHWVRCLGLLDVVSNDPMPGPQDGTTNTAGNAGILAPTGMGDANARVNAPLEGGLMYVEIKYVYQPLFGDLFTNKMPVIPSRNMRYTASFLVRDNRQWGRIGNPGSGPISRCNTRSDRAPQGA